MGDQGDGERGGPASAGRNAAAPLGSPHHIEFHIQEHKLLREEMRAAVGDIRFIQRGAVAGLGFYSAWFIGGENAVIGLVALFIAWFPFVLALLFRQLTRKKIDGIFETAVYLRRIEAFLAKDGLGGWETHLAALRAKNAGSIKSTEVDKVFWNVMIAVCIVIGATITARAFPLEALPTW